MFRLEVSACFKSSNIRFLFENINMIFSDSGQQDRPAQDSMTLTPFANCKSLFCEETIQLHTHPFVMVKHFGIFRQSHSLSVQVSRQVQSIICYIYGYLVK
jgi:hypothetical protein